MEKVTALAIIATMRTIYEESAWHDAADDVALLMPLDGVKDLLEADDGTRTAAKACDEVWGCVNYAKSLCLDQLEPLKKLGSSVRDLLTLRICARSDYRNRSVFKYELDRAFGRNISDDKIGVEDTDYLTSESQMMHSYQIAVNHRLQMPDSISAKNKCHAESRGRPTTRRKRHRKPRGTPTPEWSEWVPTAWPAIPELQWWQGWQ